MYKKKEIIKLKKIVRKSKNIYDLSGKLFRYKGQKPKKLKIFVNNLSILINKKHFRKFWKNKVLDFIDVMTCNVAKEIK